MPKRKATKLKDLLAKQEQLKRDLDQAIVSRDSAEYKATILKGRVDGTLSQKDLLYFFAGITAPWLLLVIYLVVRG